MSVPREDCLDDAARNGHDVSMTFGVSSNSRPLSTCGVFTDRSLCLGRNVHRSLASTWKQKNFVPHKMPPNKYCIELARKKSKCYVSAVFRVSIASTERQKLSVLKKLQLLCVIWLHLLRENIVCSTIGINSAVGCKHLAGIYHVTSVSWSHLQTIRLTILTPDRL